MTSSGAIVARLSDRGLSVGRLATAMGIKVAVTCYVGLGGFSRALGNCFEGACLVPSAAETADLFLMIVVLFPSAAYCFLTSDVLS